MYPEILAKIVRDSRYPLLNRDCYNKRYLLIWNYADKYYLFKLACRYANLKLVELLLPYIDISFNNQWAYHYVCKKGYKRILELILKHPINNIKICLINAVKKNHIGIVKVLLSQKNVNINVNNGMPLELALKHKRREIVVILLNDPRITINESLFIDRLYSYISDGDYRMFSMLLSKTNIDLSIDNNKLLYRARWYRFQQEYPIYKLLYNDNKIYSKFSWWQWFLLNIWPVN